MGDIRAEQTGGLPPDPENDIAVPCHACAGELYDSVVWDDAHGHGVCPHCGACVSLACAEHGPALRALSEASAGEGEGP